ncbi:serine hydrolase domain-containing protein [Catenuloplanes atrovinosus]|uniref:D-alanyl-D-alanine carboxypeptidase n=1 Tax=Catenuloplanes atrovinosus TaxID=137266 RepID=A0AAE4C9L1_9ACTN|nr:serine hydrolase domain-containing protein [Catenuloplanes atrovinosus]MDR7273705.1 D-alanyl-D-alanine carboxypeptidase [Catenuloplanes atrovinosus]
MTNLRRTAAALALLTGLTLITAPAPASARTGGEAQRALDALVRTDGFPGALAAVRDRAGRTRDLTAGVGDLRTGKRPPADGYVRIGSNTKTFTAVVVLQLVGEGRVGLDRPVETYLPGLVPDGEHITVRQLLQHTSGLANYTDHLGDEEFTEGRHRYREPRELLDIAFAHAPDFAPGAGWRYSNTGYVVLGLLVQRVTGRPLAEQITERVIDRAGLRETYFPGVGDEAIRTPHPRGYLGADRVDVTEQDPSWGWAAGQMIATPSDLNAFFRALLGGRLLRPAELAEMRRTVDASEGMWPGARYGLGLASTPLSCGGLYWGHGGDIPGFETRGGATEDGRAVAIALTSTPDRVEQHQHVIDAVDTAFCR